MDLKQVVTVVGTEIKDGTDGGGTKTPGTSVMDKESLIL